MTGPTAQDEAIAWCLRIHEGPSAVEQAELDAWLVDRPDRQQALDEALGLWNLLGDDADAPEIVALRQDALGSMQRAGRQRWTAAVPLRRGAWAALAAAVLLAVALGSMLAWRGDGSQRYDTAVGERRLIALADGSRLSLDADSAVTVAYSNERRSLTLERGRARFKVAKDPLRPFAVRSGPDLVVATGTEFSVEKLRGETRVALFEGHVAVMRETGRGRENAMVVAAGGEVPADRALVPGSELRLPMAAGGGSVRQIPAEQGWESGQLSFEREALGVAAERMNRYATARRIEVAPDLADLQVSGVFNAGDLGAFAQAMAAAFPVRVVVDGEVVRLSRRAAAKGAPTKQPS
ncbi:FecR family protein [Sphingomonas sp. 22176]|uniref:FecR family protein n=1 Tax=Sphingomonas sp. 22176 TaxID=3453884 RepID=UPI003F85EDF3